MFHDYRYRRGWVDITSCRESPKVSRFTVFFFFKFGRERLIGVSGVPARERCRCPVTAAALYNLYDERTHTHHVVDIMKRAHILLILSLLNYTDVLYHHKQHSVGRNIPQGVFVVHRIHHVPAALYILIIVGPSWIGRRIFRTLLARNISDECIGFRTTFVFL